MGYRNFAVSQGFLALWLLAACASPPERALSLHAPLYATLPNGYEPLKPTQPSSIYAEVMAIPGDNLIRYLERKSGHALNLLSLSGGGQNGAFGAGFLIGWRESGRRPQFDVVGGVSTGALLATHALLGTPADDAVLEEMYTQITKDDIYTDRGIFSLLSSDSLKDTARETPFQLRHGGVAVLGVNGRKRDQPLRVPRHSFHHEIVMASAVAKQAVDGEDARDIDVAAVEPAHVFRFIEAASPGVPLRIEMTVKINGLHETHRSP